MRYYGGTNSTNMRWIQSLEWVMAFFHTMPEDLWATI